MSSKDNAIESSVNGLPDSWEWSSLGEVSEKPQYGWTTKANHEAGALKLLRTTDITSGAIDWSTVPYCTEEPEDVEKYLVKSGDILISRAGSVGVSFLINSPERAVFASYLIRFRPKLGIDTKYFYYYLKSPDYWRAIGESKLGIAVPNVNASKLSTVPIPVAPPDQQKRIVVEIDKQFSRLDEAVANLKRVKANLKRYKAAVLKAAVEGKLTEEWRKAHPDVEPASELLKRIVAERRAKWNGKGKYKEPTAPDTTSLPPLPEGWTWASLDQLFVVERGRFSVRPRNDLRYYNGTHAFVQIGDLPREGGSILNYSQTLNESGVAVSKKFRTGTVLIAIVGATIANTGILTFDSCAPDSLVAIQSECSTNLRFAEFYLRSIKLELRRASYASGGQPNINLGTLLPLGVPLASLAEQEWIVEEVDRRFSIIEEQESVTTANLHRASRLRQSILQRAFAGELVNGH